MCCPGCHFSTATTECLWQTPYGPQSSKYLLLEPSQKKSADTAMSSCFLNKDTWLRQPVRTTSPFPAMDSFLQWVQSVKQNHVLVNGALNWRDGGFSFHKGSVCVSLKPTWLLCTQELCVSQLATVLSILESDHDKRVVPSIKISSLHKDQAIYCFYYFFYISYNFIIIKQDYQIFNGKNIHKVH